ncbi:MAG: DUF839 domain-containing protein [Holophaga sp.]|nr:DUF839 domain-containing protein [Holophaga sp.]
MNGTATITLTFTFSSRKSRTKKLRQNPNWNLRCLFNVIFTSHLLSIIREFLFRFEIAMNRLLHFSVLATLVISATPSFAAGNIDFTPSRAPVSEEEMVMPFSNAVLHDGDKEISLQYHPLFRSGDLVGGVPAGLIVDRNGKALASSSPDKKGDIALGPFNSWSPDANSLIQVAGAKSGTAGANRLFLVTHFEYHTEAPSVNKSEPPVDLYANLPMAMNRTSIDQNHHDGKLSAVSLSNIDMSGVNGLWTPCAASLTPWNSHMGSEEYEPDARHFENKPLDVMNLYLGKMGLNAAQGGANAYDYGHAVEVRIHADGSDKVEKHYAMGRLAFELADVMPDGRTAYFGDDGKDVGLFMFVADKKSDLSAGTLYAARFEQTDAANGGAAKLSWLRLGHAKDAEIRKLVRNGVRFSDQFEVSEQPSENFRPVHIYTGTGGKTKLEYLKLKPGMAQAAAFLETRRYAAWLGATTEFTKMEGQTHSVRNKKLYTALSYIEGGMLDGKNESRPRDDIHLSGDTEDLVCGAVFETDLKAGVKDTDGKPIHSEWAATATRALITGARKPAAQTAYGKYDKCDTDRVANPDNLKYSDKLGILFIGEDSGNHLNNFLWAYRTADGKLTRLGAAPIGAEWTGLQVVENANGYAYLMSNIQHPGAAKDLKNYPDEIRAVMRTKVDQRGAVGYFGPFPAWK